MPVIFHFSADLTITPLAVAFRHRLEMPPTATKPQKPVLFDRMRDDLPILAVRPTLLDELRDYLEKPPSATVDASL